MLSVHVIYFHEHTLVCLYQKFGKFVQDMAKAMWETASQPVQLEEKS